MGAALVTMNRRGVALLAALWFVVAIATVGLALGLEAAEHRTAGLAAADRGIVEAAAAGGREIARARLERIMRQLPRGGGAADRLRASDPWLDVDSLFRDTLRFGNVAVLLHGEDLQAKLNISTVRETDLRTFLAFVLQDYGTADALSAAIADWRDRDDLPRPRGAEREDYVAHQRLDLPTNRGGFRDLDELRAVQGMTPKIFARIRPFLRVQGDPAINVNSAPPEVLRAIPGMTDAMIMQIMAFRSQHQRVNSLEELGGPAVLRPRVARAVTFATSELALTATVIPPRPASIVRETWTLERVGDQAEVRWTDFGR